MFISQFKQGLTDCMTESSRCDTYKEIKSLLNVENIYA